DFSGIEWHRRGNTDGLNLRLLQFPSNIDFFTGGIGRQTKRCRIKVRQLGVAQIPTLDIEMRLQILEGAPRLQFDRQKSGRGRLHPEVIEQFLEIEIRRIKSCVHLSVTREKRLICTDIFPNKWDGCVTGGVFRLPLVELDFRNLERLAFGGNDRLEIHPIASDKEGWNLEPCLRISRVEVRSHRLHVTEPAV